MNLLAHHIRKDLGFIRGWTLLTLLIAAGILWFPTVPLEDRVTQITWLSMIRYGGWLMLVLAIGRMVQLDAPFRDGAFLRTRPAAPPTMIASKCVTALLLIVPMAMLECVLLALLDLKPGFASLMLIFSENLLILSAIAAVAMALALRKDSFGKWFASALIWGGAIGIASLAISWFKESQLRGTKPEWSYTIEYLKSSRLAMFQLVALTGACFGIIASIRVQRHETISKILGITAVCAIAVWLFWPINFVEVFVPRRRTAPQNEWPDLTKVRLDIDPTLHSASKFIRYDSGYNGVTYRSINSYFKMDGLPADWEPVASPGYRSSLHLVNGKSFDSDSDGWGSVPDVGILKNVGIGYFKQDPNERAWQLKLTEFKLSDAVDGLQDAYVKGKLYMPLKRPVLLGRIPLKAGNSVHIPSRLISVTKAVNLGDEISFNIVVETASNDLRGGWQQIWTDRIG